MGHQFGRVRSVIGRTIRLNGIDFTVIGVAPESFTGMDPFIRPVLYVPLTMSQRLSAAPKDPSEDRAAGSWQLRGRLKPGVSREQAQAELIAIAKNLAKAYPDTNRNHLMAVRTELQARMQQDPYDSALAIMLMALVGLVLLIACANVANLLLSRAGARSREIAIRLAMGISRARLIRQLLTESMILSLFGGMLGLGLAYLGIRFLKGIPVPTDLPVVIGVQMDRRVLLASLLAAVISALIFGIAPAWQAIKTGLIAGLCSTGLSSSTRRRTLGRNALVVGQVAFSMVLLVAAGMILDGFRKAMLMNPGFRTDHIMLMEFDTRFVRYSDAQSRVFYRNVVDRASTLSGVRSVALGQAVPMAPNQSNQIVIPEGYQFPKGQETVTALLHRGRTLLRHHENADPAWPRFHSCR